MIKFFQYKIGIIFLIAALTIMPVFIYGIDNLGQDQFNPGGYIQTIVGMYVILILMFFLLKWHYTIRISDKEISIYSFRKCVANIKWQNVDKVYYDGNSFFDSLVFESFKGSEKIIFPPYKKYIKQIIDLCTNAEIKEDIRKLVNIKTS